MPLNIFLAPSSLITLCTTSTVPEGGDRGERSCCVGVAVVVAMGGSGRGGAGGDGGGRGGDDERGRRGVVAPNVPLYFTPSASAPSISRVLITS